MAYLKKSDWLKSTATRIIELIQEGKFPDAQASSELLHELYCVFSDHAPLSTLKANFARIVTIPNLEFIDATPETYISAVHLAESFSVTSIFDAIHAATALGPGVPDHSIVSTDEAYDRIAGLKRIDPREIVRNIPER